MTNYYITTIKTENKTITFETDSMTILCAILESFNNNEEICVCDGFTGEVLLYIGDELYFTEEFTTIALKKCFLG